MKQIKPVVLFFLFILLGGNAGARQPHAADTGPCVWMQLAGKTLHAAADCMPGFTGSFCIRTVCRPKAAADIGTMCSLYCLSSHADKEFDVSKAGSNTPGDCLMRKNLKTSHAPYARAEVSEGGPLSAQLPSPLPCERGDGGTASCCFRHLLSTV